MNYILPALILSLLIYAYAKGIDVYSAFTKGAAEALPMMYKIIPCMAAMTLALSIFRQSGAMAAFVKLISPVLSRIGMPPDLAPLFILRPFSGGAAMALLQDVYNSCGVDSYEGIAASIMLGSTETIFYTISLYLGSIGVTKPRHALPAALISSVAGAAAALVLASALVFNGR